MRDIKFRAWNNDVNDMFFKGDNYSTTHDTDCVNYARSQDVILMQYTGLKDNEGKEIYEGDILHEKYGWVVEYKRDGFIVTGLVKNGFDFSSLYELIKFRKRAGVPIEVIGNIYENPELL